MALELVRDHPTLSPFIAVNPAYMHPFTVARCIATIANSHGRRCHLNLVAGTALSDLVALGEEAEHDERYVRLREFAEIVLRLCSSATPTSYDGEFFAVRNLHLRAPVPPLLRPGLLVAGQSPAAAATAQSVGACALGMLQPDLALVPAGACGVHLGVVCRATDDEAWSAARALFPPDESGERLQRFSARNTDAAWKANLLQLAEGAAEVVGPYWLGPFRRFQLDCPALVGEVEVIAACFRTLLARGVDHLVIELPPTADDYGATSQALAAAGAHVITGEGQVVA